MDDDRFDAMVRQLGAARSRRSALRIVGGTVLGTAAMAVFGTGRAHAKDCPAGQTSCDNFCVDLSSNRFNCGACGNSCGEQECSNGVCGQQTCPSGQTLCRNPENEPACTDLMTDGLNCGACNHQCNGSERCANGTCGQEQSCEWATCNGQCVNTQTDRFHCGGCGYECPGGQGCYNGRCA